MTPKREITRADIMALEDYKKARDERKRTVAELKKNRRVTVGPDATFYFESYDTMLHQVHEMLYIERGGDDQIAQNLALARGQQAVVDPDRGDLAGALQGYAHQTAAGASLGGGFGHPGLGVLQLLLHRLRLLHQLGQIFHAL